MLHRDIARHITVTSNSLAVSEQLEVNRKHHESKEHDNALADMEGEFSLCV